MGAGLAVGCLALFLWSLAAPPAPAASPAARDVSAAPSSAVAAPVRVVAHRDTLSGCEVALERAPDGLPTMAVVGASFTAGVGPGNAALSWAVRLARTLSWNAVVDGVPGVGYVRTGSGHQGPVSHLLGREDLRALRPALVIVQAGHDDSGVPAWLERERVSQTIAAIRAAAPQAQIALLTVFASPSGPTAALTRVNDAIIAGGEAADRDVIIVNPLGSGWRFPRAHGIGLHPSAAGDTWIADQVATVLRAHGVHDGIPGRAPVICDSGVRSRSRTTRLQ